MGEIVFVVEDFDEGGYAARTLGCSIHTEGMTLEELKENIRDAVKCHFDEKDRPRIVRLHTVKDELMPM